MERSAKFDGSISDSGIDLSHELKIISLSLTFYFGPCATQNASLELPWAVDVTAYGEGCRYNRVT